MILDAKESLVAIEQRTLIGALFGAAVGGGLVFLGVTKDVRKKAGLKPCSFCSNPLTGLAAGAVLGLAATYVSAPAAAPVAGVGRVHLSVAPLVLDKDKRRQLKIAEAGRREARAQAATQRNTGTQQRVTAQTERITIRAAQKEDTAINRGYDPELVALRAQQFDDEQFED